MPTAIQVHTPNDIETVLSLIKEGQPLVAEAEGKEVSLVLGQTGSGKSTFVNIMQNIPMHLSKSGRLKFAEGVDEESLIEKGEAAKIGHGSTSETTYPQIYQLPEKYQLVDCAGFGDNRDEAHRLAVNFALEAAVKKAHKITNIFVMINFSDLTAKRGESFKELSKMLGRIFLEFDSIRPNIHFVLNNFNDAYQAEMMSAIYENGYEALAHCHDEATEAVKARFIDEIDHNETALYAQYNTIWARAKKKFSAVMDTLRPLNPNKTPVSFEGDDFFQDQKNLEAAVIICDAIKQAASEGRLSLLNATSPKHIAEFRASIIKHLGNPEQQALPNRSLNFSQYDTVRMRFEHELDCYQWDLSTILEALIKYPAEISQLERLIEEHRNAITLLSSDLQNSREQMVDGEKMSAGFKRLKQLSITLDFCKRDRAKTTRLIEEKEQLLREKKEALRVLDSDREVTDTHTFTDPRWHALVLPHFVGWSEHTFSINRSDAPYVRYSINSSPKGEWEDITPVSSLRAKETGQLKIQYASGYGEDGHCEVTTYHKSRYFKDNPRRIVSMKTEIEGLERQIFEIKTTHDAIAARVQALEESLKRETLTIAEAQKSIEDLIHTHERGIQSKEDQMKIKQDHLAVYQAYYDEHYTQFEHLETLLNLIYGAYNKDFQSIYDTFKKEKGGECLDEHDRAERKMSDWSHKPIDVEVDIIGCHHKLDMEELRAYLGDEGKPCPCCLRDRPDGQFPVLEPGDYTQYRVQQTPLSVSTHYQKSEDELVGSLDEIEACLLFHKAEMTKLKEALDQHELQVEKLSRKKGLLQPNPAPSDASRLATHGLFNMPSTTVSDTDREDEADSVLAFEID